jgi:hypothetical protein
VPLDTDPSVPSTGEICLRHLKTLKLYEFSRPVTALRSIRAPSLTYFQYRCPKREFTYADPQFTKGRGDETVTWFVENSSSTLKTLAIDPGNFPRQIALPLFQLAIGISHLFIGRIPVIQMSKNTKEDLDLPPPRHHRPQHPERWPS